MLKSFPLLWKSEGHGALFEGFNNKIPRTLQEALAHAEGPDKLAVIESEFLWPEAHSEEGDTPVEDSGMYYM